MRTSILALSLVAAFVQLAAAGPLRKPGAPSASDAVARFEAERDANLQLGVAREIMALGDRRVLPRLEHWLRAEDRHARGNAALIFAGLGDPRGLQVLGAMLTDFSDRPEGQHATAFSDGRYRVAIQIHEDRYYAVHLLGELGDPRALPMLIPLLADDSIDYNVAWALGETGGDAAVNALIGALAGRSPDLRASAILALQKLRAHKALAAIRALLTDGERTHGGALLTVGETARAAVAALTAP